VCVNDALMNYMAVELPMGGWKASGMGTCESAGESLARDLNGVTE